MISVAMTTYNGEKYLREQIDSILNQTYKKIELIICDDASTDRTKEILKEYADKDSRIKNYFNEKNLGFKKNFEKAISLCTGDYIALSDQDDIWLPNHIEFLLNNLNNKSLSGANAILIDSDGNEINKKLNEADNLNFLPEGSNFLYRVLFTSGAVQGASQLMPKEFIKKCLPIPEAIKFHDAWFLACALSNKGISYSFDIITKYRQHGNNITFNMHNPQKTNIFFRFFDRTKRFFQGTYTDRFCYIHEITKRFNPQDDNFIKISNFYKHIEQKKITLKDIVFLWKNYENINTTKGHKKFLIRLIGWLRMKPNGDINE